MRHRTLPPVIISGLDSLTPAHTNDDDLSVQMAAFEKIINAQHPG